MKEIESFKARLIHSTVVLNKISDFYGLKLSKRVGGHPNDNNNDSNVSETKNSSQNLIF